LIWGSSFPEQIPTDSAGNFLVRVDPAKFFPPFIAYGVKYYDAYTHALLRLQPRFSDYSAWINFALKTLVCDELVPHRPVGQRHQTLSQWQSHMGLTWRLFDHPNHFDLFPMAQKLIDLLEDVMEPYWDTFHTALHTAISRRTLPALAEGLKQLPPVAPPPDHTVVDPIPETGDAAAKFPIRAQWLADRLQERSWNKHDLYSNGGPDHKTGQKVLDGLAVRPDILEKIARALSMKVRQVSALDIPRD